jgi:hypothetical protein
LYMPRLAATNNLAERQLRPGLITRKTGGGHRTTEGAAHSILASSAATCRQQAVSILDYFTQLQQFGATPPALVPARCCPPLLNFPGAIHVRPASDRLGLYQLPGGRSTGGQLYRSRTGPTRWPPAGRP